MINFYFSAKLNKFIRFSKQIRTKVVYIKKK